MVSDDGTCTFAEVSMLPGKWSELERKRACLSREVGVVVYWDLPEVLGELGPDVRVAVGPDAAEYLVVGTPTSDGYVVRPYGGQDDSGRGE